MERHFRHEIIGQNFMTLQSCEEKCCRRPEENSHGKWNAKGEVGVEARVMVKGIDDIHEIFSRSRSCIKKDPCQQDTDFCGLKKHMEVPCHLIRANHLMEAERKVHQHVIRLHATNTNFVRREGMNQMPM